MRLGRKIVTLLRAGIRLRRPPSTEARGRSGQAAPARRPAPLESGSLSLDPASAWGVALEPAELLVQRLTDFVEQLALEAYHNGEGFEFEHAELEQRVLAFLDKLVERGELKRLGDGPREPGQAAAGPKRWVQAQQVRIRDLVNWWRLQGGPDIEARVI